MKIKDEDVTDGLKTFMVDYSHDGEMRKAHIFAIDWEDAQEQLASLQDFGYIEGELVETGEVLIASVN